MFDDGILLIYKKEPVRSKSGTPTEKLVMYIDACYGDINFTTAEYYAAKQSNTKVERRVRIHQDKSVCNKHVVIIDEDKYEVGRTFHGLEKGIPITDITLERVTAHYDIG